MKRMIDCLEGIVSDNFSGMDCYFHSYKILKSSNKEYGLLRVWSKDSDTFYDFKVFGKVFGFLKSVSLQFGDKISVNYKVKSHYFEKGDFFRPYVFIDKIILLKD